MVRIAVFSDIHCGKLSRTKAFSVPGETRDDTDEKDNFEEGLINLLKTHNPDYLFIAGDLTSVGSPQEFVYCEKEIIKIADAISLPYDRIICCTGNHDVDWGICNLKETAFEIQHELLDIRKEKYQHLSSYLPSVCLKELSNQKLTGNSPAPFSGIYQTSDFIVFMLNSGWLCEPIEKGKEDNFSHGKLSKEQLDWFEKKVNEFADDTRKRIVLMHHHPFNFKYPTLGIDISQIEESGAFVEYAEEHGIDLVIHGHRHHPKVKTYLSATGKRPITFFCAGSLAVNAKHRAEGDIPNTMHFIDVDKDKDYFVIYNYSYRGSEGWTPMVDKPATPMDRKMKVGKVFTAEERVEAVLAYKDKDSVELEWDNLAESLQYIKYQEIRELLREQLGKTHNIIGCFPETVAIRRRC